MQCISNPTDEIIKTHFETLQQYPNTIHISDRATFLSLWVIQNGISRVAALLPKGIYLTHRNYDKKCETLPICM